MFIDLSFGPLTIDPARYPTTLVVSVDAPTSQPVCGVFAGNDFEFSKEEMKQLAPFIGYDRQSEITWKEEHMSEFMPSLFVIDRPKRDTSPHIISRWHYSVIGWQNAVYVEYPYVHELTLQECKDDDGVSQWSVSVGGRFSLCLPDYQPGAVVRGVVELQTR